MDQTPSRILLVEDYEANILVATTWLEIFGYHYDVARTGAEAIEKANMNRYAAILMDVQLPDLNGFQATKTIRDFEQANQKPRTPIIGVTARAFAGDRTQCMGSGMDDYITKPIDEYVLRHKLACICPV